MMLYDSVYRQVISLSSQVACCFSTEQTCGWLHLMFCFTEKFSARSRYSKTGATYELEEELVQLKNMMLKVFVVPTKPNGRTI